MLLNLPPFHNLDYSPNFYILPHDAARIKKKFFISEIRLRLNSLIEVPTEHGRGICASTS